MSDTRVPRSSITRSITCRRSSRGQQRAKHCFGSRARARLRPTVTAYQNRTCACSLAPKSGFDQSLQGSPRRGRKRERERKRNKKKNRLTVRKKREKSPRRRDSPIAIAFTSSPRSSPPSWTPLLISATARRSGRAPTKCHPRRRGRARTARTTRSQATAFEPRLCTSRRRGARSAPTTPYPPRVGINPTTVSPRRHHHRHHHHYRGRSVETRSPRSRARESASSGPRL